MNNFDIAVLGGGASGFFAAITAKKHNSNLNIAIIEKMPRVLKKVLATGNGTCNLSNANIDSSKYHGDSAFMSSVYSRFDLKKTLDFFKTVGIITETDNQGRIYPSSRNASSVVDALRFKAESMGIRIICDFPVKSVSKKDKFIIKSDNDSCTADKLILATGGTSSKNLGSDGSGFALAEMLGHSRSKLFPAICPYKTDVSKIKSLRGIRVDAEVSIAVKNKIIQSLKGELLFAEYGLSGNLIFKLSRSITEVLRQNPVLNIDFLPETSAEEFISVLYGFRADAGYLTLEEFLMGFFPKAVGRVIISDAGIKDLKRNASSLTDKEISDIARTAKCFEIIPTAPLSFEKSQITCGGLNTNEFDSDTLESKKTKNLFACGEILNIDGDCGGYNLQWAWSSGFTAGLSASY